MATARVQCLPGGLGDLGAVLRLTVVKDKDGERLLKKFSVPRNPTKADPRRRILASDDPEDFERLCLYCEQDVRAEQSTGAGMDEMTTTELGFWLIDQEINRRGLGVDRAALLDCIDVIRQVLQRYGDECRAITGFNATQLAELKGWMAARGHHFESLDAESIERALDRADKLDPQVRRVLELRALTGSASVKKTYAMERMLCRDDRLRDLFIHHGARTGRPTGADVQPLNLPRSGPKLVACDGCGRPHKPQIRCPWCGYVGTLGGGQWKPAYVDHVLEIMSLRSIDMLEWFFGDALLCVSGCVRGLFVAGKITETIRRAAPPTWGDLTLGDDMDLIASDYSAIEAVVAACISGETWRIEAFERNDPIYLVGASKITGKPLQFYLDYKAEHGDHHPDRQNIGKVSELACGFGGWIGSYKAFGSTEPDDVIKAQILAWRGASPAIVEAWGGQFRGMPWEHSRYAELYGIEGHFIAAVQNPNVVYEWRGIRFEYKLGPRHGRDDAGRFATLQDDKLIVTLLSGRELTYHQPRLAPSDRYGGGLRITYMTWNSNPKYGLKGWVEMETYGGRLFENIVQATAHCIQRYGITLLRMMGYPIVLHVYDENVGEVPHGFGSIEEFEQGMSVMPPWAIVRETGRPWPIRASGGWRGRRFRKG